MKKGTMPIPDGNFAIVTGFKAVEGRDPKDFAEKVAEAITEGWQPWGVPFVVPSALGQVVYAGFLVRREIATDVAVKLVKKHMGLKDAQSGPQGPDSAPPASSAQESPDGAPSQL